MSSKDNDSNETYIVTIKDGYKAGDILTIKNNDVVFAWDSQTQELTVEKYQGSLKDFVNNLELQGEGTHDRFVEISIKEEDDSLVSIAEFPVYPNANANDEIQVANLQMIMGTDDNIDVNVIYEDNVGAAVLPSSEEVLPYLFNHGSSGDIYTLVKESFTDASGVEIWGYDFGNDKIDLTSMGFDSTDNLVYDVSKNSEDNSLHLYISDSEGADYSIVFKESNLAFHDGEDLDSMIQSIILNNNFDVK